MNSQIIKLTDSLDLLREDELKKIGLEERLAYMDKLCNLLGPEPNIFEQFIYGRGKEAKAIQDLKANLIKAKSDIISVLGNSLMITVKQEESLFSTAHAAQIIGTSELCVRRLNQLNEKCINDLLDDYEDAINFIESKTNLNATLKQKLLQEAVDRLQLRQADIFENYRKLVSEFRKLISDVVSSVRTNLNRQKVEN